MFGFKEVSREREKEILADLEEAAKPHVPFFVLVATSTVIATFGLLLNSPAVVIGAMLVAPLMTPIFSLSVALIRGRARLLERAVATEAYGVGMAVGIAVLIGLLVPEPDLTTEILARTQPTLFDLAVALAAGLAGAFALVREEVSPALPGVAIAVALLPPLAVVGLGLSMRRWDVAGGALILFLANFVAIHLVSAGIFYLHGLATPTLERNPRMLLKSFGFTLGVLLVMAVFLGLQLSKLVQQSHDARVARTALAAQVKMVKGAQVSAVNVRCGSGCQVVATVETPELIEPVLVQGIQNVLEARMERPVELVIRSVQMSEASAVGFRFATPKPAVMEKLEEKKPEQGTPEEQIRRLLSEQAKMVPGAKLVDFSYDAQAAPPQIVAVYLTNGPFEDALEQGIANLLRSALGAEVEVELKYVGPLPEAAPTAAAPSSKRESQQDSPTS